MITIDDKLELFRKVVLQKVIEEHDERSKRIHADQEQAIQNYEKEAAQRKADFIRQMEQKAQREARRMISKARSDAKNNILATRQTLIDELIASVRDRIHGFAESEIYTVFLKDNIRATLEHFHEFDDVIVELTYRDFNLYADMIEEALRRAGYTMKNIRLARTDEDIIGGFVVYNGSRTVRIDFSLAAVIADNKRFMGRLVYDIIAEAGDDTNA